MKTRTCKGKSLNTGVSACPYDREKNIGAILVPHGYKLPADLDGSKLEELCHANTNRVHPISTFCEYAKNGGEPQVSAVGYGANEVTDVSAMTDTYTMDIFNEIVNRSLSRSMNTKYDCYFFNKDNMLYGMDDGTDTLAGFPMSCVYPTATPYPTSGAKATLLVNFCYKDARKALENANFEQLDFNICDFAYGLTPVKFIKVATNKFKIVEVIGGLDRTAEFGATIAATPTAALKGAIDSASYDSETETLTISDLGTDLPQFKDAAALYTAGIKGIEQE